MNRNEGQRPWGFRRKVVISTLLFCALTILLSLTKDTTVAEAAVTSAFALAGAVIGSYIFGAVWNDKGEKGDGL